MSLFRVTGRSAFSVAPLWVIVACGGNTGPKCTPQAALSATHLAYHVSAGGSPGGDGSSGRPWDLATALDADKRIVHPGDTVWLHGGTYSGAFVTCLSGTATDQIVFRQFPGERATIDGTL